MTAVSKDLRLVWHSNYTTGNEGFIFAEEAALKRLLTNAITVTLRGQEKAVPTWFRFPEGELSKIKYPFITIDLLDMRLDRDRAHVNPVIMDYIPNVSPAVEIPFNRKFVTDFPIPLILTFQVRTFARDPRTDRTITNALTSPGLLPFRGATLHIPEDGTTRRMYLRDFQKADYVDDQQMTVFRNIYTIDVEAEKLTVTPEHTPPTVAATRQVSEVKFSSVLAYANPAMVPVSP